MKKLVSLLLSLTFITSSSIFTFADTTELKSSNNMTNLEERTPRVVMKYEKTITKTYGEDYPSSIYYSEYTGSTQFSGTLYVDSVQRMGTIIPPKYMVTYKGTLFGNS